jgi:Na+/H+ antiporter NhaD/arsenite permease-like protein
MSGPSPILIVPFILLLGAMALAPVLAPHWWHRHYPKVALGLGAITAGVYLFVLRDLPSLQHAAHEYLGFIVLIGALYVVAGGILLELRPGATPLGNVLFLLIGAVAANVLGTTGAAMLLIRPWIQMNRHRIAPHHIAFFIFLVANVGGCLTPIGDPPLFLGFLQGIPFWWVAEKCWPMWALGTSLLLAIFYVVDRVAASRSRRAGTDPVPPAATPPASPESVSPAGGPIPGTLTFGGCRVAGLPSLFFLAVTLGAIFLAHPPFLREGLMLAAAAGSYFTTSRKLHAANEFTLAPVMEVAVLFAGIFVTMIPALAWLEHGSGRLLGDHPSPAMFYWGTGALSAVLDNAPTYLGFLQALFGVTGADHINDLLAQKSLHVTAVSIGAVFFGAATYIGNGPNFMVKAIAEARGVPMPSFVCFVARFSLPYLVPVLVVIWLRFFLG